MAIAIDATVGGASANSFATLAEFTTYMEGRLNSDTFDSATTDEQNRALVEATRELSARVWVGRRASSTQALAWPRDWATNPDSPTFDYYDNDVIPQRVKNATMELAFQFLVAGTTDIASLDRLAGVKRKRVDVLETEYDTNRRPTGLYRYPRVMTEVGALIERTGPTVPLLRG